MYVDSDILSYLAAGKRDFQAWEEEEKKRKRRESF